jgi:hypothetical protein
MFPRYPFQLTGANEPIVGKHKCQKIWNKNFTYTSRQTMFTHNFLERKNILYVPYKKDKFVYEHMTIYGTYFCLFYRCQIKCSFLSKTCAGTLNVLNYMWNLFFHFFDILNFIFLCIFYNRFIWTWEPKHLLLC